MQLSDFEAAYDEHSARVFGFLAYRLGNRAEAEDLTQTTFEKALGAWDTFDPSRAGRATWLLAIARNLLIDHHRAANSRPRVDTSLDEVPDHCLPSLPAASAEPGLAPDLEAALARLGDRERELIALRYGGDLNGPELAQLTGLSLANVQQILSRSLRRLRAELEPKPSEAQGSDADDRERGHDEQRHPAAAQAGDPQG